MKKIKKITKSIIKNKVRLTGQFLSLLTGSTSMCHEVPSSLWSDMWAVESPLCCLPCLVKQRKEAAVSLLRCSAHVCACSIHGCGFHLTNTDSLSIDICPLRALWRMCPSRPGSRTPQSKTTSYLAVKNWRHGTTECWRPVRCCPTWTSYLLEMLQKLERRYGTWNYMKNFRVSKSS